MTDQDTALASLWTHPGRSDAELLCEAAQREFGLSCEAVQQGFDFQTRAYIDRSGAGHVLAWAWTYMIDLYRQRQIHN
jgi:hypothetical protein